MVRSRTAGRSAVTRSTVLAVLVIVALASAVETASAEDGALPRVGFAQTDLAGIASGARSPATSLQAPNGLVPDSHEGARVGRLILELEGATTLEQVLSVLRTGRRLDVAARTTEEIEELGAVVEGRIDGERSLLRVDPSQVEPGVLEALDRVRAVHEDEFIPTSSVTVRAGARWHVDRLDQRSGPLDGRYHASSLGSGVLVYVVDSGIYPYRGNAEFDLSRTEAWYDSYFLAEQTLQGLDCNGHGTHVAGTVAGQQAGVAPGVRLISVKANYACDDGFWTFDLLGWFEWIVQNRRDTSLPGRGSRVPAVVNLSLSAETTSTLLDVGVANMVRNGITVVVAAGNSNQDACRFSPARVGTAVTVGASDQIDRRASFSNHGGCVNIHAPGVAVLAPTVDASTCPWLFYLSSTAWNSGNCMAVGTAAASGTSMAAPIVTGLAARYLETNRSASPSAVKRALERGAVPSVGNLPSRTTNRLANGLFLEGADPSRPTTPAMGNLRVGSGVTRGFAVRGGRAPVRFDVIGGSMPPGLTVDPSGAVTGQVSGFGAGSVTVRATDAVGRPLVMSTQWASIGAPDVGSIVLGVSPGNRTLNASWATGAFDAAGIARGAEVSRVEVRATPVTGGRSGTCSVSRRIGRGAALGGGCAISGLVNGTTYRIELRAQNRGGWSPWREVADLPPDSRRPAPVAPSVIRSLRVQAVSGELRVTWAAPAADGGAPPSYDVQVRRVTDAWAGGDAPSAGELVCAGLRASQRSCTVTGADGSLQWGVTHEVRVRASNSQGASGWVVSGKITPFAVPTLGGSLVEVAPSDRVLAVGWDGVEIDSLEVARGAPVTRIEVRAVPVGPGRTRVCTVTRTRSGSLADRCDVVGLENGRTYLIEMRAQNRAGWTPWSLLDGFAVVRYALRVQDAGAWTPSPVPLEASVRAQAPAKVSAEAGIAEVLVTWDPPLSDDESASLDYLVTAFRVDDHGVAATCETSQQSCLLIGLDDDVAYRVEVVARNASGFGESATAPEPVRTLSPIGLDRDLVVPGSDLQLWAGGFLPGGRVVVELDGWTGALAESIADSSGRIEVLVEVPEDLPSGRFTLRAAGQSRTTAERTVGAALTVDGVVPVLGSLVLSSEELDVSEGPGEFSVSLMVEDDLSGVESVFVSVVDPAGVQMFGAALQLVEGDQLSGVWRATFTVPRFAMAGEWRVSLVAVEDRAFNTGSLVGEDLERLGPLGILVRSDVS
jgi:subtilisin family serine protease